MEPSRAIGKASRGGECGPCDDVGDQGESGDDSSGRARAWAPRSRAVENGTKGVSGLHQRFVNHVSQQSIRHFMTWMDTGRHATKSMFAGGASTTVERRREENGHREGNPGGVPAEGGGCLARFRSDGESREEGDWGA
jgi:hypothetical protein